MSKAQLPVVEGKITLDDCISVGSDEWFEWLKVNKSFNYEPIQTERFSLVNAVTVRNRSADYWYAYRKVNNKLRQLYVGKTAELDYEKLQDAAIKLSLNDTEYYKLLANRKRVVQEKREAKKSQVVQPCLITTEVVQDYYNAMYNSSGIAELQVENEQLQSQLAAIQAERDELAAWKEKYVAVHNQLWEVKAKLKANPKLTGYSPNSASGLIKELQVILAALEAPNE